MTSPSPAVADLRPVAPVHPLAPYVGGKRALSRRLCELIAATPHQLYLEPFVGMGGVFLRRRSRPRAEIVNDLAADVANLFRIVQRHPEALERELAWSHPSRAGWELRQGQNPAVLTDVERAARFLYLQRLAFGGKVVGRNFGVHTETKPGFSPAQLQPMLRALHGRLADVVIEQLPYQDFIARYDRPGALFYCDPPYAGTEGHYGPGMFGPADHARLAEQLRGLKGRFILSINDTPGIRALYDGWAELTPVGVLYGLAAAGPTTARELIITGRG